MKLFTKNQNK